jgi:hypothetical protein
MKDRRLTIFAFVAGAVLVGLLTAGPPTAMAQLDPQLFVCQSCTSGNSGDPNLITNTGGFNVGTGGNHVTVSPLLIIVAVYDGGSAPTVSYNSDTQFASPGGAAIYGWGGGSSAVSYTSDAQGSAYNAVGIANDGGGSSAKFSNFSTGDTTNGFAAPTSFDLYVYELSGVTLPATGAYQIDLSGAKNGSYVLGYACQVSGSTCTDGSIVSTPMTESGLVDTPPSAPEASAVTLTSLVLLAFGALVFRARRSEPA